MHKLSASGGIHCERLFLRRILRVQTDLHLLSRYHRHGDAEAFQSLVEAHAGMVHATAQRVTRDASLAQDVAQETFLALARSSGSVIQSVGAWLHHVAWQKALNAVRGESRRQSYEQAAAVEMNESSEEATWSEFEPLLDETLSEMPEPMRAILIERFLVGCTQQELAARVGISQPTVSRRIDLALHELRSRLQTKGVLCGAGLTVLLGSHSASAAPAGFTASLGKLSISGLGTHATITPGTSITTTLLAMTTTAKLVFATAAVALVSIPMLIQRSPHAKPKTPRTQVKAKPVSSKTSTSKTADAGDTRRHYRPAPVTAQTRQIVDGIIRRHTGMSKAELQKSAELNKLMDRFIAVMNKPEILEKVEQRMAALPRRPGAEQGLLRMDFEMVDDAHGRAWLEAAVSNDQQRIEDWLLNTLDDAVFEFAFNPDLERTTNGVSVQSVPTSKTDAPADSPKED